MSAILSGVVRVVLETTGKGDGPAKVKAAEKSVKDLEKAVGATGAAADKSTKNVEGFTASIAATKESIKPLDSARGLFESLRANSAFLVTAFTAVGGALALLISALNDGSSAMEQLNRRAKEFDQGRSALERGIETLRDKLGLAKDSFREAFDAAIVGAGTAYDEMQHIMAAMAENSAEAIRLHVNMQREQAKLNKEGASGSKMAQERAAAEYAITLALDKNIPLVTRIRELSSDTAEFERLKLEYLKQQSVEILKQLSPAYRLFSFLQGVKPTGGTGEGDTPTPPKPSGGKSKKQIEREQYEAIVKTLSSGADRNAEDFARGQAAEEERRRREVMADYEAQYAPQGKSGDKNALKLGGANDNTMAADIRDFSAALSEALPGMDEFSGALAKISDIWAKWGGTAKGTEKAVIGSLGAIAQAGAAQIKDERLRAGVLSIIELGLGLSKVFVPGMQAEAAGHFAAAAVLGSVAIFGGGSGGKGGSKGSGGGRSPTPRVGGETLGGGNITYNINAPWFGPAPQESAAGVVAFIERPRGTGYEARG